MLFSVVFIISSVFQVYGFYLLMHCFYEERNVSGWVEFLAYVLFFAVTTLQYLVLSIPLLLLIFTYGGITLISILIYKGGWKKGIILSTMTYAIMTLAECIVALLSGYLQLNVFWEAEYYSIFGTIALPILQYLIVFIVRNLQNIRKSENIQGFYWLIFILLPLFTIYLHLVFYNQPNINPVDLTVGTCILFIINIFVFYLYDYQIEVFQIKQEKETLELQNKYQLSQMELMNRVGEQARAQHHDFEKHISMIAYLNEQDNRDKLAEYLEEIRNHVSLQQKFVDTGNFVIDSILNYKIQKAVGVGIHVQTDIKVPAELELSAYDINIILANLLDNSIEALSTVEESKKEICVVLRYNKGNLYIQIKNPYDEISLDNSGCYITKKQDKESHGYGLKNVEDIVNGCDGRVDIETEENMFKVRIFLPV